MKQSPFQLILLIVAAIAIIVSVLIFAFDRRDQAQLTQLVTVWGTMPADDFNALVVDILDKNRRSINVQYQEYSRDIFEEQLVEQLAAGIGPDIVMLPQDLLVRQQNKIFPIPYEFYPERTFKDIFIEEGELALHPDGILGIPFTLDPLVMYWNRSTFTKAGLSEPPKDWKTLLSIIPQLTVKDSSFAVTKSGVALGEFENIKNAKEIFASLMFQAGNSIVKREFNDDGTQEFRSSISDRSDQDERPTEKALRFYTQFSNPSKEVYSWNRSLPDSDTMFISGDLAVYFGFASEYDTIRRRNPNLNFDVTLMPTTGSGSFETFGKMQLLSVSRSAKSFEAALHVINTLTSVQSLSFLSDEQFLPPVRRDLLRGTSDNAVMTVMFNAALRARAFYDIDPTETEIILQDMIESYVTNRAREDEAISRANSLLNEL